MALRIPVLSAPLPRRPPHPIPTQYLSTRVAIDWVRARRLPVAKGAGLERIAYFWHHICSSIYYFLCFMICLNEVFATSCIIVFVVHITL